MSPIIRVTCRPTLSPPRISTIAVLPIFRLPSRIHESAFLTTYRSFIRRLSTMNPRLLKPWRRGFPENSLTILTEKVLTPDSDSRSLVVLSIAIVGISSFEPEMPCTIRIRYRRNGIWKRFPIGTVRSYFSILIRTRLISTAIETFSIPFIRKFLKLNLTSISDKLDLFEYLILSWHKSPLTFPWNLLFFACPTGRLPAPSVAARQPSGIGRPSKIPF